MDTPDTIADAVLRKYQSLPALALTMSVSQEDEIAGQGIIHPLGEVLYAKVVMAPDRIKTDVFRPGGERLMEYTDTGTAIVETTATSSQLHPFRERPEKRDVLLAEAAGFDGCLVGSVLSSWVGPDAHQLLTIANHIRTGRVIGVVEVDGHRCTAVRKTKAPPAPGRAHFEFTFYVDVAENWIRKRTGTQMRYSATGAFIDRIERVWLLRDFEIPESPIFVPCSPWGVVTGELQ